MHFSALRRAGMALILAAAAANAHAAQYSQVDTGASRIEFAYAQMGVAMKGNFNEFQAQLDFDTEQPANASATLEIALASIDAGYAEANDQLQGAEWFDATHHPVARFVSQRITATDGGGYELAGQLTIKGRTHDVRTSLDFSEQDGKGVFDGSLTFQRTAFGIGEGQWADTGIVGDDIEVRFRIIANRA